MPESYRVLLSPEAAADLEEIRAYVARDSAANAAKLVERLLKEIDKLEMFPHRNVVQRRSRKLVHSVRSIVEVASLFTRCAR